MIVNRLALELEVRRKLWQKVRRVRFGAPQAVHASTSTKHLPYARLVRDGVARRHRMAVAPGNYRTEHASKRAT